MFVIKLSGFFVFGIFGHGSSCRTSRFGLHRRIPAFSKNKKSMFPMSYIIFFDRFEFSVGKSRGPQGSLWISEEIVTFFPLDVNIRLCTFSRSVYIGL